MPICPVDRCQLMKGASPHPLDLDLLLVSPTFSPELVGTPVYATDAMRWFAKRGARTAVVTAMPFYPQFKRHPGYGRHRRYDQVEGIPVLRLPTIIPRSGAIPLRALSELNFAVQGSLRNIHQIYRPRSVLSFSPAAPLAVWLGHRLAGSARHVAMVHDIQSALVGTLASIPRPLVNGLRATERRLLSHADQLLCLSPHMADELHELGITQPVDIAPIWVDVDPCAQLPSQDGNRCMTVMYSGNLGRKQGALVLTAVGAELTRRAPHARLLIQGEGPLRPQLQKDAHDAALRNVEFRPLAPRAYLAASLQEGDIHLVPQGIGVGDSVYPSKLFNIMASRRPAVVAAARGSALDHLAQKSGAYIAVPPGDPLAMASATVSLLEDSERRTTMANAGYSYVTRHHSRDAVLGQIAAHLGLQK